MAVMMWLMMVEDGDSEDEDQSESDEMVARDSPRCGDWPLDDFQTIWTYMGDNVC